MNGHHDAADPVLVSAIFEGEPVPYRWSDLLVLDAWCQRLLADYDNATEDAPLWTTAERDQFELSLGDLRLAMLACQLDEFPTTESERA